MKIGWYEDHSPPSGYNPAAYVPSELEFKRGTARESGEPISLEAKIRKAWKPIGEVVDVDDTLYLMMKTNFRLYTMALQGSDSQLVNNIGDDLRNAFDRVLSRISRDAFDKSPFWELHRRYQRINKVYTTKPQQMEYTGIAAMVTTPLQFQPKK